MAPPKASKASSSKKRKTKEPASTSAPPEYDAHKFLSLFNQNQFHGWIRERAIIPEVSFQLGRGEYREIQAEINLRGWTNLCHPLKRVVISIVREFYANASPPVGQPLTYQSYVRGKVIDYSPGNIERTLEVRRTRATNSYEERVKREDPGFDDIINEICVLGTEWKLDTDGRPNQLRRRDLCPPARGWLEFVRRSLNPTSNSSEVTLERAVLIYSIMKHEQINVGELIANNIQRVITSTKDSTRLAFPSIIQLLCNKAGVEVDESEALLEVERPITAKRMEKVVAANPLQRARAQRAAPQALQMVPAPPHQQPQEEEAGASTQAPQQDQFNWAQMQETLNQIVQQQRVQGRNLAEFRALYEARSIQRRTYDINTQAKLNYLSSTINTLNPKIPPYEQVMDSLRMQQEGIVEQHKAEERAFMERHGMWKPKETQEQGHEEEASVKRAEDTTSKVASTTKDKGKAPMQGEGSNKEGRTS